MNKLYTTVISAYLILWLISSCATKGLNKDSLIKDSESGSMKDADGSDIPVKIESFPLDIIPPSSGVQFYMDGIVFLSESKNEEKISSAGHLSFGTAQAYYADLNDTTLGQHLNFSPKTPFPYPCDAISFSNNFGTMYFTKKSGKNSLEKIFRAEVFIIGDHKQEWTFDTEPLEFCKGESIYSHPAVSPDGSMMIFSSNNPLSTGGMDLFITRNENMKWSEPENLGKIINTTGNEIFPVLDRNNNLYFSSNKLPGYGGYDIFICKYIGNGWNSPVGMTNYINSKNDEFAFTIDRKSGRSAFFTSKLMSKSAKTQLYRINLNEGLPVKDNKDLSAYLYDMSVAGIDTNEIRIAYKMMDVDSLKAAKIRADSIETAKFNAQRLEDERLKAAKMRADSLEVQRIAAEKLKAANLEAERIAAEKLKADKIEAIRLEAERIKAVKMKADSLLTAKQLADRIEAERARISKLKADSIQAARIKERQTEAERIRIAKVKADSIKAAKREALRIEASRALAAKVKADSLEKAKLTMTGDEVVYKVQFLSSIKPSGINQITVDGKGYDTFEYFYLREYRYTIGKFSTLEPAVELQNTCRKSGYPQAFVVAFKNNIRSLDLSLFR